jgi:two-component system response regulator HydG
VTTLITGESGTGKELVANALVAVSPRAAQPFLKFNCAAVPRELAEAELFGHAAGAFTGAARARVGLFRQADGGTLFLDEIGELDLAVQGKLLRVLQQGEVRTLGEDRARRVDVRIVAATNRDLEEDVRQGRIREDLYYRLAVVLIHVPPLRERPEDIEPLVAHFLDKHARRFNLPPCRLSAGVREALHRRPYRGNVRELENMVERLVALSCGGLIDERAAWLSEAPEVQPVGLKERVEAFERGLLIEELQRCGGNRSEAARRLRVARVTLLDKLRKYNL